MQERHGLSDRLGSLVRWLLLAALVCAALVVVGRHVILGQLDEQIRRRVHAMLVERYPGMDVRVQAARRVEGKGIEIRGLSIASNVEESSYREMISIDELFLACRADLSELLSGQPCIRQLIIRRMKIQATRNHDRQWNIAALLPSKRLDGPLPEIVIEGATLKLRDRSQATETSWVLRDIAARLMPKTRADGTEYLQVKGTMLGDHFKRVRMEGQADPAAGNWSVEGTVDGLEMSPRLLSAMPADMVRYLSFLETLRTRAHLVFRVTHERDRAEPIQWVVQGRLTEGRIDDPRLPNPLTGVVADVYCDNHRLSIENARAQSGSSSLRLSCRCDGFLTKNIQLTVSAAVVQLPLDRRLFDVLPESAKVEWKKFDPSGLVDATLQLHTVDGRFVPDVQVICHDVAFVYYKFPYRLQHAQGTIEYKNDAIRLSDFTAQAGSQTIHIAGEFQHPGPAFVGWMTVDSAGPVVLDENLINAMKPEGRKIVRSLHSLGTISLVRGKFEKTEPGGVTQTELEIDVNDCSVQFERFPYPIQKITGKLFLRKDRRWEFRQLKGFHGSACIQANGHWLPAPLGTLGGELTLAFECFDVPLDDALRTAIGTMNPGAQRFWISMRPRGSVDHLDVTVYYDARARRTSLKVDAEKWPPSQNVEGRSMSVHPQWLPLRMDDVVGRIWYGDGQFRLINLKANHGNTTVELAGEGSVTRDGRWDVNLNQLIVDQIQLKDEVIEALPEAVRPALRGLKFRGPLNLNGNMWLRGGEGLQVTSGWDILVDIENGAMENELALQHINGGIRFIGGKSLRSSWTRGELEIDSMVCRDVQFTRIRGPLWIDPTQLVLGLRAESGRRDRAPRPVTAKVWSGNATFNATIALRDQLPFGASITLSNAAIAELARSMGSRRHDLTGRVFANLRMTGTSEGVHTFQGKGQTRLVEADIYELPVMVALLSFLSLRPPDTTAFTQVDIDFRLNGDQVNFDRIDFSGDAISLKGSGWMDLKQRINLNFYALVGRQKFQVPIVSALLAEASRNILLIQVLGTIDEPKVVRKALPELDETLQKLFPELEPAGNGTPPGVPTMGSKLPFGGLWKR